MFRLVIAIRLLFGLLAGAGPSDPAAESQEGDAARLKAEEFQEIVAERLEARVEYLTSTISSEALADQIELLSTRLTDLGKGLVSTPASLAQAGSMHCRFVDGGVLRCTVVPGPAQAPDLSAGRGGSLPPAALAED